MSKIHFHWLTELFQNNEKKFVILFFFIAAVVLISTTLQFGEYIIDDAGISFTYARHLIEGEGLVINPGGEKVEGYSNPLWVFLIAVIMKIGLFHPIITPKVISVVLILGTFIVINKIYREFNSGPVGCIFSGIICVLIATNTSLVMWSTAGLENPLYIFLIIWSGYRLYKELNDSSFYPISGILFFLTAITRPEGIVYVIAGVGAGLFFLRSKSVIRQYAIIFGLFSVLFLIYHIWHYSYFKDIFPNTYYAKQLTIPLTERLFSFDWRGWSYIFNGLSGYSLFPLLLFLPAALLTARFRQSIVLLLLLGASLGLPLYSGGDWMLQYRFLYPTFFLIIVIAGLGVVNVLSYHFRRPVLPIIIGSVFLIIFIISWKSSQEQFTSMAGFYTVPFKSVKNVYYNTNTKLGDTLLINQPTIQCADLGATSYYGGLTIYDVGVLADYHIARYRFTDYYREYIFEERKPDFLSFQGPAVARFTKMHQYEIFHEDYAVYQKNHFETTLEGDSLFDGQFIRKSNVHSKTVPYYAYDSDHPSLAGWYIPDAIEENDSTIVIALFWTAPLPEKVEDSIVIQVSGSGNNNWIRVLPIGYHWYLPKDWRDGGVVSQYIHLPILKEGTAEYLSIEAYSSDSSSLFLHHLTISNSARLAAMQTVKEASFLTAGTPAETIQWTERLMMQFDLDFWKADEGYTFVKQQLDYHFDAPTSEFMASDTDSLLSIFLALKKITPGHRGLLKIGHLFHDYYIAAADSLLGLSHVSHLQAFKCCLKANDAWAGDPLVRKKIEMMRPWVEYLSTSNIETQNTSTIALLELACDAHRKYIRGSVRKHDMFVEFVREFLFEGINLDTVFDSLSLEDRFQLCQLGDLDFTLENCYGDAGPLQIFGDGALEVVQSHLRKLPNGKYLFDAILIPHSLPDRRYVLELNIVPRDTSSIPEQFKWKGVYPRSFGSLPALWDLDDHKATYVWREIELLGKPDKYSIAVFVSGGPPWYPLKSDAESTIYYFPK
ncbi:MAG: hypothetical protein KAR42_11680 [candidate division Zixibacteria bacterium]|nr:hypothetical protein [candidate division Zixibacteria bacterium]